jgi:hypothetical protein
MLLSIFAIVEAKYCTFIPPAGWEIAQLKNSSPHVQIGFIGKGSGEFRPSINLASEEVDVSLKEYLKAVKELQTEDPTTKWRDLGKFSMKSGIGRLTEISSESPWGELKIIQDHKVYILTAAILKEELHKFQNELLESLQSLTIYEELWSPIQDENERVQFESFFSSLGKSTEKSLEREQLKKYINSHPQLGPYWQFLALQEGMKKLDQTFSMK